MMTVKKGVSAGILMLCIAVVDIIAFSPGFIGLSFAGGAAEVAGSVALVMTSLLSFVYGSYVLILKETEIIAVRQIKSREDVDAVIEGYLSSPLWRTAMEQLRTQIRRSEKKKNALVDLLQARFEVNSLTYNRFLTIIGEVEKLIQSNVRSILSRVEVFFASDVLSDRHQGASVAQEYIDYVLQVLAVNDDALLKMDRLLIEIARLESVDVATVNEMQCMQEIEQLIHQTKYYKQ